MTSLEPIPDSALKRLGGELAQLLDDDQWNNTEKRYLLPALEEQDSLRAKLQAAEAEVARLTHVYILGNADLRAETAQLRDALEKIADFNCEREGWRNCKCPCGECESCIARAALEVKP